MKTLFSFLVMISVWVAAAQTEVNAMVEVTGENRLVLDLAFADDIEIRTWDKGQVRVNAQVTINGGEDDERMESGKSDESIWVSMDKDCWENADHKGRNCRQSEIHFTVYLPCGMTLEAESIIGNFILEPLLKESKLKTISGDIYITVPNGLDFKAKTISGEVYSDLKIEYSEGKEGLKQIVGMDIHGRVSKGGPLMNLETISGNIYLRDLR